MYGREAPVENFLDDTPTLGHASALVGVVKRYIDGRLRLETKGPAVQC